MAASASAVRGIQVGQPALSPVASEQAVTAVRTLTIQHELPTGGDRLRLRWLIQGKRAEDGGHNLVKTVTAH
jgi:hypothetical protein